MTDEVTPSGPISPEAPADPTVAAGPPSGQPPSSAAAATPGRMRPAIVIGAIVAILAIVLFVVRNNVSAEDLKVGDCFNVPNGTSIKTVEKLPCTDSHDAEVIFAGEYTGSSFPIAISLDRFIEDSCVPAFESYLGRGIDSEPELSVGYFHPTRDGWDNGDRTITCYVAQPDESKMTKSLKG